MLLKTEGLWKSFAGVPVLKDVGLGFGAGRIHALLGENGAGKSTLVKILAGVYSADSGRLRLEGREVRWRTPADAQAAGISLIPQELNLALDLTVAENVFLGVEKSRFGLLRDLEAERECGRLVQEYGLDFEPGDRVALLSPSQRQQVEILRALVRAQRVLILDESTAYFSERESARLFELMRELRRRGLCLIFITHRLEELEGLADDVSVLRDGACVASVPMTETSTARMLSWMVGGDVGEIYPDDERRRGPEILRLEQVGLPGRLEGIGFHLHRGEILGLGGFVGSRRTLVAELLFGLRPEYTGQVFLDGRPVRLDRPSRALEHGIAFVTEDRKQTGLFPHLNVLENAGILSLSVCTRLGWISIARERGCAQEGLRRLSVRCRSLDQPVIELSGGNQQKVLLARWLMRSPRILLLDEPTRGVDVGSRVELYRWFSRLAREGLAVLLISSDLRELEGLCDRVVVLREGRMAGVLEGERVTRHEVVRVAALGRT